MFLPMARRLASGWGVCVLCTLAPLPALGDEIENLRETVAEQGRLIEQLSKEVERLSQRAASSESAAQSAQAAPDRDFVTAAYVDERIADFEDAPVSRFLVSGYGTSFLAVQEDGPDRFGVAFNPGFHFRMAETLHFNGELEIELEVEDEEVETHFGLEFAQVDLLLTDWLVASGGKFLTPFGTFGPRLHPTWINKLASPPPIYGGHESGGMIPILTSIGAMASGGAALWSDDAKLNYGVYVANGATAHDEPDEILDIEFDNAPNLDNVTTGGRIGFLPIGNLELGASYMTGNPDGGRFHLAGADAWYFREGLELRGELAYLTRSVSGADEDVWGYWTQAAYRLRYLFPDRTGLRGVANRLEGVVRWGQIFDFSPENRKQLALGLNYWLFESAPIKLSYELNSGTVDANRFFLQFAYGF